MRLLAGVVATLAGTTHLTGDDSLRCRPMDRVAEPLARMGATVSGQRGAVPAPAGRHRGLAHAASTYTPPMASAQVKSAVLLAGHRRRRGDRGPRAGGHPGPHRGDAGRGRAPTSPSSGWGPAGRSGSGGARSAPGIFSVPGDPPRPPSGWWPGVVVPGSLVTVAGIQLGIERLGFLGVLRRMGATIEMEEAGSLTGSVTSYTCALHGTVVEAAEIPSLDEVPVLAVAAAAAHGTTRFREVGELRVKESDRLAGTADAGPRPSGRPPRWRATIWWSRARADRCAPARGRRPGRPPHGHGRGRGRGGLSGDRPARPPSPAGTPWPPATPGFARDPRPAGPPGRRGRR